MTPHDHGETQLAHHAEFKLSITKALGDQLAYALKDLTPAPLTLENIRSLRPQPGVYQLYLHSDLVYVGKADRSLPQRIEKHFRKISGRTNIDIRDMGFKCLYVDEDFGAVAPERLLINEHRKQGQVPWNYNGFGNNDPGKRRDMTEVDDDHFDRHYPIDLYYECTELPHEAATLDGSLTLTALLQSVKQQLPYVFRYESSKHFDDIYISVPELPASAHDLLSLISESLPLGWQITALPGYVIMYPKVEDYPSGWRYYRGADIIYAD
ncbi:Eco29kI family restriction endonuclease [Streptomyces hygroscopicus]|uniref:Eco29kI family restriction endonuclease n=1 Tax=Streptomyces hygroscopicus TaxID=1912 RepID=UPI0033CB6F80